MARTTDKKRSAPNAKRARRDAAAWTEHEHVSEPAKAQARRLVDELGSPELAKQAVDSVAGTVAGATDAKERLARELGFVSYLDLFEASTPVRSSDERNWFVTSKPGGTWVAWNEQELAPGEEYDSMEGAMTSVNGGTRMGT
jgi:hypothetical protein